MSTPYRKKEDGVNKKGVTPRTGYMAFPTGTERHDMDYGTFGGIYDRICSMTPRETARCMSILRSVEQQKGPALASHVYLSEYATTLGEFAAAYVVKHRSTSSIRPWLRDNNKNP